MTLLLMVISGFFGFGLGMVLMNRKICKMLDEKGK